MSKYNVIMGEELNEDKEEVQVTADSVQIENNCLKFFENKKLIQAFAQGSWLHVSKID